MNVIGLMSGTSADGIDAAVMSIADNAANGLDWQLLAHHARPFEPALREEILACVRADTGTVDRICALNVQLGEVSAKVVLATAAQAGLKPDQIDLVGSHGQTIWHISQSATLSATLQIGSAATIAERTGISVVSNFRARDIAAGGHGAPLVALADICLLTHPTRTRAAQNIGGIANVTYLPAHAPERAQPTGRAIAFDTGPGNMLIDDHVRRLTQGALQFDPDGSMATEGHVHRGLLTELRAHPFVQQRPPKTTGREQFGAAFAQSIWVRGEQLGASALDRIATVTMFTAQSIALAYRDFLPQMPDEVIVSGGGVRNHTLMQWLAQSLEQIANRPIPVHSSDEIGMPPEAKEAMMFAVLAYLSWHGRSGNWPPATGATRQVVLGEFTPGRCWPPQAVWSQPNPSTD